MMARGPEQGHVLSRHAGVIPAAFLLYAELYTCSEEGEARGGLGSSLQPVRVQNMQSNHIGVIRPSVHCTYRVPNPLDEGG